LKGETGISAEGKEEFMKKGLTGCKIKETEGAKAMEYQEIPG